MLPLLVFCWLTRNTIHVISPRPSFAISASVGSSILCIRFLGPWSRCTPTAMLDSNHAVASLQGLSNTLGDSISSTPVVFSQKRTSAIYLRNSSSVCVLEAANLLNWESWGNVWRALRLHQWRNLFIRIAIKWYHKELTRYCCRDFNLTAW